MIEISENIRGRSPLVMILRDHRNEINNYDGWFGCHGVGPLPEDEWEGVAGGRRGIYTIARNRSCAPTKCPPPSYS